LKRAGLVALAMGFAGCKLLASAFSGAGAPRPNILIIFTDDQGYADLACFGNAKNKTPRMDQLAREGTRFTNFYAQTVCGPSRAALLSGRYPFRSLLGPKTWQMPSSEVIFAELLKSAGYQTCCIGKWDVSGRKEIIDEMPNAQGFDYYFGALGANDGGILKFHENNRAAGETRDMSSITRLYTNKAMEFLKKRDPEKPFVLYLAHTMMHMDIDASERFKGKSKGGLYGDTVEEFDYETGCLLDLVDELKLRDNTLVIYTSDNGPWKQLNYRERKIKQRQQYKDEIFWGDSGDLRGGKGSCYEGGYRLPCIARWPGRIPAGKMSEALFTTLDFLPTFAALAGSKVPDDRIIDGVNQVDLLLGKSEKGNRNTFYYQDNGIRFGKWKYLKAKQKVWGWARDKNRPEKEELYDLENDIGEKNNLAVRYPEVVKKLRGMFEQFVE